MSRPRVLTASPQVPAAHSTHV